MKNWAVNIIDAAIGLIPYFLRRASGLLLWSTADGLIWVTSEIKAWGSYTGGRHIDWVSSLVSPVQNLNNDLVTLSSEIYYKMNITGQVIYLEHYLNDLFDPDDRLIYIYDDSLVFPPFLYRLSDSISEDEILYLYPDSNPIYLYNQIDYFGQGSFIICVPVTIDLTSEMIGKISAAVNYYKQAGVAYKIEHC